MWLVSFIDRRASHYKPPEYQNSLPSKKTSLIFSEGGVVVDRVIGIVYDLPAFSLKVEDGKVSVSWNRRRVHFLSTPPPFSH